MRSPAARSIIWGQICLYGGLLVAVALKPQGLAANSGISYYGIFARTIVPYTISIFGSAFFSWQAAIQIHDKTLKPLRDALFVIAIAAFVIGITPYSLSHIIDDLHRDTGSILFSLQLLLSIWLIVRLRYTFWAIFLAVVELAAGIACAVYLNPAQGLLIQSETLFQLAFGILLVYSLLHFQHEIGSPKVVRHASD